MFLNDDDMVECPYNKTHRMLRRRLQTHLLKCRLNYPDVELRKCPFNITHLIPEPEFAHHATNCPDRKLITQYKYDAPEPKEEEVPKHAPIECDEEWDDTNVNDYNPQKYLENANVLRKPDGANPSERKQFIKKERKRLGDGDDSSDDESNKSVNAKGKLNTPTSFKRGNDTDESHCPTRCLPSSHKSRRDRSRSSQGYRKSYRDYSPARGISPDYSRPYTSSSNSHSLRRTLISYPNQDPYQNDSRRERSNNIAHSDHSESDTESDTPPMPRTPPPPIISYPSPRSYLTSNYPTSSSD